MKKALILSLFLLLASISFAQAPHIYEHDYPAITEPDLQIRALMDSVSLDSIQATIEHLCSYWNRRCDSYHIYDVQDWLFERYNSLGMDTVIKHDFKINKPGYPEETADNIIAIQWGVTKPEEYVVCGAHYDSWNNDGSDPDTIRAPGADDNATGVAGIWETARLLSQYKFDRTVIYCNWCAEEIGLIGSAAYAKECAEQGMDIVGYFNLDMTGYLREGSDIHIHVVYVDQDSLLAKFYFDICHTYYPEMPVHQNWMPHGDSDFSSFNRNGYPALHPFEDVYASSPYIHTRQDVLGLSVNNLEQSKRFAEINLAAVALLAGINHTSVAENEVSSVTMYPNPAKDEVSILAEDDLLNVRVYNLLGQQIETQKPCGENKCILTTNSYAPGIYIVQIVTKKGTITRRLVID